MRRFFLSNDAEATASLRKAIKLFLSNTMSRGGGVMNQPPISSFPSPHLPSPARETFSPCLILPPRTHSDAAGGGVGEVNTARGWSPGPNSSGPYPTSHQWKLLPSQSAMRSTSAALPSAVPATVPTAVAAQLPPRWRVVHKLSCTYTLTC